MAAELSVTAVVEIVAEVEDLVTLRTEAMVRTVLLLQGLVIADTYRIIAEEN